MLTLIENGEVYTPDPVGRQSILLADGHIGKVGQVNRRALETLGAEYEVIDVEGCIVIPGLIDPHQHLLGGSGEEGFSTQSPEFFVSEIVQYGITTVVGALGVDTTMKTMAGLLAKVKALREEGLNAFCWTGGYNVPPTAIMQTVRDDILFIEEVIGAGEIAISDLRAMDPQIYELARVATDCYVGGMLAQKAGVLHIHVGDQDTRLAPIRTLLEEYRVEPSWIYPTHIQRTKKLMDEAIALAKRGMVIDMDTMEEDFVEWLPYYLAHGGPPENLTASSDAAINSPRVLWEQVRACIVELKMPIEQVMPHVTRNTARFLKLKEKGELTLGKSGDLVVVERDGFEIVHVLSQGKFMVRDGRVVQQPAFLEDSMRDIHLVGGKSRDPGETGGADQGADARQGESED
jgi:beta-aspartyl-dipeptidase (metallo-type)